MRWLYQSYTASPKPAAVVVPTQFYPEYPDQIERKTAHAAFMPALFFVIAVLPAPDLSWQPIYPDFARTAERVTWFQPHVGVDPDILSAPDIPLEQRYPAITRSLTRAAEFPSFFWNEGSNVSGNAEQLEAFYSQPDFARDVLRPVDSLALFWNPDTPSAAEAVPEVSWLSIYPDFARATARIIVFPAFFWNEAADVSGNATQLDVFPEYPDFTRSLARASDFPSFAWSPDTPISPVPEFFGLQATDRFPAPLFPESGIVAPVPPIPIALPPTISRGLYAGPRGLYHGHDLRMLDVSVTVPATFVAANSLVIYNNTTDYIPEVEDRLVSWIPVSHGAGLTIEGVELAAGVGITIYFRNFSGVNQTTTPTVWTLTILRIA